MKMSVKQKQLKKQSLVSNSLIVYRKAEGVSDIHFVVNSWTRSLWKHYQHVKDFPKLHHERIVQILQHANVMFACDLHDPSVIFGYVVWEPDVLHWVYVKHPIRRMKVATNLLIRIDEKALKQHSHFTPMGNTFVIKKHNSKYNPYILERWISSQ